MVSGELPKRELLHLENIAKLLLEDVGLSGFSTNEAEHMGSARCHGESIELDWPLRFKAMEILTRLNQQYGGRISSNAGPLSLLKMVDNIKARIEAGEKGIPGRGKLVSCGGAFGKMAVLHDGSMVPCNMLPKLVMGVIGIHDLKEAWLYHPAVNLMRYRRQIPLSSLPECKDCQYIPFCAGGCPAGVVGRGGGITTPDTFTFCYKKYLEEAEKHGIF
jgi:SynChlorMet cassette radical SAM/SPASM protein ScmE